MDREQLKAAIEADVISADQAARLEVMFGGDDRRLNKKKVITGNTKF